MDQRQLLSELKYKAIRSSGAGGQHVNKVSSKIELTFDLSSSEALSDTEKNYLRTKLKGKLTQSEKIVLYCDDTRSQHKNKSIVTARFLSLIKTALKKPKKRKPTRPTKSSVARRLETKQKQALKKRRRQKPEND